MIVQSIFSKQIRSGCEFVTSVLSVPGLVLHSVTSDDFQESTSSFANFHRLWTDILFFHATRHSSLHGSCFFKPGVCMKQLQIFFRAFLFGFHAEWIEYVRIADIHVLNMYRMYRYMKHEQLPYMYDVLVRFIAILLWLSSLLIVLCENHVHEIHNSPFFI